MMKIKKTSIHTTRVYLLVIGLVLAACGKATPPATVPPAEDIATQAPQAAGFQVIGTINRDTTQAAQNPALALGPNGVWVSWAENSSGNVRQIFVSELVGQTFEARGSSLNIHVNAIGDFPTITVAGENNQVPWVTWSEPSPGFNDVSQIFASRFSVDTGLWQQAGQDRGGGEASINLRTNEPATHPFIFSGSTEPGKPSVPWIAWEEKAPNSAFTQIFVTKGIKDDSGDPTVIGGFKWETVGKIVADGLQTLSVDRFRNSLHPTGVFAETANSVPWVTWHEADHDRPSRIFTARGVADANAPGGFNWVTVPACQPDETACALNINPLKDAKDASMAAGSLTPGESSVPWIAWPEIGQNGKWQIFVSRLDTSTRNSFLQVGASLNADPNHDARTPIIVFVGNVPYVAWLEDDGTGTFKVQVRHLASDPLTGTWTLDTPQGGFNFDAVLSDFGLNAVASDDTLFMAWTEGDPASTAAQVVIGALKVGTAQP
jgi:hypothetical protein